jgi:hypothetical protein
MNVNLTFKINQLNDKFAKILFEKSENLSKVKNSEFKINEIYKAKNTTNEI